MNIAVNGFFLSKPKTGIGQYTIYLLDELLQNPKDIWTIFVPTGYDYTYLPPHIHDRLSIHVVPWVRQDLISQVLWERYIIPRLVRTSDVLWSPYQSLSVSKSVRTVMTVHDIIPWKMPEYIANRRQAWYFHQLKSVIKQVSDIITISEFSKGEIQTIFGDISNITVTLLAPTKDPKNGVPDAIHHDKYILYFGGFDTRKNIVRLIESFKEVVKYDSTIHLYLPGNYHKHRLIPNIPEVIQRLDLVDNVHMVGYVSDKEMVGLIQKALLVIFPSEYEGFGLPILESMVIGTPVITSSNGVMKEVGGSAAYYINPYSVEDMAQGMITVLKNDDLRKTLSEKGLARARAFSWKYTAQETYKVIARTE